MCALSSAFELLQKPSECCLNPGILPERHIANIRRQLFGIGSGKATNERHAHSSNAAIARLAMSAHCSPFHFICELMQNVADAQTRLQTMSTSNTQNKISEDTPTTRTTTPSKTRSSLSTRLLLTTECLIALYEEDPWLSTMNDLGTTEVEQSLGCLVLVRL